MANVATHHTGRAVRAGAVPTHHDTELGTPEIAALALSLAHLGAGPQATTARRALRTLLDLGGHDDVVTATLATLTGPLDAATADRARVVAAAITEHRVVRLCYGDAGANVTIREVEPVTCLVHRDHWYLVGWCRMRRGVRAFRFDRILAVEPTGLPARPRRADRYLPFQRRVIAGAA
ncbi:MULTISPECIES: helix-turn-helix transcriptional regulator [Thermomonosporaceae]|uniref:helix-turn-helix transcriptional regulator n=1 Tax=Thermomonosporaceae TaxID=2012 RepID=UPI00255B0027|nr:MULTISPECIES: WYL domain-containing protein [Thermomonosporaceae]MDL4771602.1 WYL domain-containing protein [Actinomadura xylanilytica]